MSKKTAETIFENALVLNESQCHILMNEWQLLPIVMTKSMYEKRSFLLLLEPGMRQSCQIFDTTGRANKG